MKLFLRDHIDIIALYVFDAVFLSAAYHRIDGFRTSGGIFYFLFLSLFLLLLLLVLRYFRKRKLYRALTRGPETPEDMIGEASTDAESAAFFSFGKKSYELCQRKLNACETETNEWRSHLMQWVHQLKTPISVIRLMVQDTSGRVDTFGVLCELDRMQSQLDLMLGLARSGEFRNDLVVEEIPLRQLAEDAIQRNKRLFIQYRVFPKLEGEEGLLVQSDRKWLSFVIEQLLHNAVKYSPEGSRIEMEMGSAGTRPALTIRDHGAGIRQRDLPRIFELYYTGSNGRENDQSSGIGLYLVKTVLDALGHRITVESETGRGTTATVIF